jgi:6-phosphogluconolactonase
MRLMQSRSHFALGLILPLLLAFAGCGTNSSSTVCPDNANNACGCGQNANLCLAPQFLYASGLSGEVTVFPVDSTTGALGQSTSVTGPTTSLGATALNNQFFYVSDFQNSTLSAWSINPSTGVLTTVPGSPFTLGTLNVGAGLASNNAAGVIYVADVDKIDAFKADATGALTALPGSPFASGTNLYLTVDPQNRFAFSSADDPPGNVFAFTVDSSGALTAVAGSPFPTIPGFAGNTQPGGIVVDSTGSFVYTTLRSTGQVAAFSIVAPSGVLSPVPGSPFTAGNTPLSLTTINNFLYVSNAMGGNISGYSITPGTGVLNPLSGSPFAIPGGALTTDPSGHFLYASGGGGILAFTIDATTGALAPIAGSPFPNGAATVLTFVQ